MAKIVFAPKAASATADEYCGLVKAGVLSPVSIGFQSIGKTPNKFGGWDHTKWLLLEISIVATPCNPNAFVVQPSFGPSSPRYERCMDFNEKQFYLNYIESTKGRWSRSLAERHRNVAAYQAHVRAAELMSLSI